MKLILPSQNNPLLKKKKKKKIQIVAQQLLQIF